MRHLPQSTYCNWGLETTKSPFIRSSLNQVGCCSSLNHLGMWIYVSHSTYHCWLVIARSYTTCVLGIYIYIQIIYIIWLVVLPYSWDDPIWLSYFFRGLGQPPTSIMGPRAALWTKVFWDISRRRTCRAWQTWWTSWRRWTMIPRDACHDVWNGTLNMQ